jgi:hypothetical protein
MAEPVMKPLLTSTSLKRRALQTADRTMLTLCGSGGGGEGCEV